MVKYGEASNRGDGTRLLTNRSLWMNAMACDETNIPTKDLTIISRKEAKSLRLRRYFTGKPCKHGHICERLVGNCECIECRRTVMMEYRADNKEHLAAQFAAWAAANKMRLKASKAAWCVANKEKRVESKREYRKLNNEAIAAYNANYYDANKGTIIPAATKRVAKWRKCNQDKKRVQHRTRRSRKHNVLGKHTAAQTVALLAAQGFICNAPHCDANLRKVPKHLDHKNPLSRPETDPTNSIENLQWLCASCNTSKGNKTMKEWIKRIESR